MNTLQTQTELQSETTPAEDYRKPMNRAAAIATLIALPFMLLLMFCAWLPYWFGMYFFILGGLLFGAIWFRQVNHLRPIPAMAVYLRMALVLAVLFGVYMGSEYVVKRMHLARGVADAAAKRVPVHSLTEKQTRYDEAMVHVDQTLAEHGPGPIGYYVWNATDGKVSPLPQYGGGSTVLPQRGAYWVTRVVLSMVLLTLGMRMGVKELTTPDEPVEIVEDAA